VAEWRRAGARHAGARHVGARARCLALTLLLLLASACSALRGRDPEDRRVTVELPVSRSEAVRRTLAVFRVQGYKLQETLTSATEPVTERFRHGRDADAVFRAAITSEGRRSRVVFTGTYRRRDLGGLVRGPEREVRRSDDEVERELWARLQNLAITLRRER
jgi:hypothetical protein